MHHPSAAGSVLLAAVLALSVTCPAEAGAKEPGAKETAKKAWCAPEVNELSDHVCWADGGVPADGRRTLVVYMHGAYATNPGFAWVQQRAMALHAKRLGFTVLLPTSPLVKNAYVWPTSEAAQKEQEAGLLAGIAKARADVAKKVGHGFDETFVVGFSSGAYYASSLAVRGGLDVDGFVVLAGGSSWARSPVEAGRRAPVFVGVSGADPQTADHSRAYAGTLAQLAWPYRVEERKAGHEVDWSLLTHGIAWLRSRRDKPSALANASARH